MVNLTVTLCVCLCVCVCMCVCVSVCLCVCEHVHVPMCTYTHMFEHSYGSQRWTSGIFFSHSPPYFLRQGLLLTLEVTDLAKLCGVLQGSFYLCAPQCLDYRWAHSHLGFFICSAVLNSGPDSWEERPELSLQTL